MPAEPPRFSLPPRGRMHRHTAPDYRRSREPSKQMP